MVWCIGLCVFGVLAFCALALWQCELVHVGSLHALVLRPRMMRVAVCASPGKGGGTICLMYQYLTNGSGREQVRGFSHDQFSTYIELALV